MRRCLLSTFLLLACCLLPVKAGATGLLESGSSVLVADFTCLSGERNFRQAMGAGLHDMVAQELEICTDWQLYDKESLNLAARETAMAEAGLTDSQAMKLGQQAGVRYVLYGSLTDIGEGSDRHDVLMVYNQSETSHTATVTMKMVDTETGDILAVSMGEGDAKHVANSMMILVPEAMNAFSLGNLNAEETEQTRILAIMEAADNAVRDLLSQMEIAVPKK